MSHPATTTDGSHLPEAAGIELSKPQRKTFSSLGHQVVRLAEACDRLRAKPQAFPGFTPWLAAGRIRQPCSVTGSGIFACPIVISGPAITLHPLVASEAQCAAALPSLPSGPPEPAGVLAPPDALNDPIWPALLRLRPLREFWERELRRSTVDQLLELLPDAWLLDPAPLPPGSVIPRLELASWSDLNFKTRRFIPATAAEIAASLSAYPENPGVLMSLPDHPPGAVPVLSFYLKKNARVDWLGIVGRQPPAGQPD